MGIEAVKEYLKEFDAQDRIIEFDVSSATVELAAKALDCPGAWIAKTLSFYDDEGAILVVAAGDAKVDNAKFKHFFGKKARMLAAEDVERLTGHRIGGVCPFAVAENVRVFTDVSLKRFPAVYPACGSANSAIRLSCDELFRFSKSLEWIDVCKGWEEESR